VDLEEAPPRVDESDFGARNRTIERSVPLPFRIVAVQGVLAIALALTFVFQGREHAIAVALAALVMIVPSVLFAWRVASTNVPIEQATSAARKLLGSGIAKSLATVGLMVGVFAFLRPEALPFFVTMIALQSVFWFAPLFGSDA
jgi:F0F1-type ATP synthase assembly protein I